MIISHKHRFIFVKTDKTAGTSIEIALSEFCGEEDIITPIVLEDEKRRAALGFRGAQNYKFPLHRYTPQDWLYTVRRRRSAGFYNHAPISLAKRHLSAEQWTSYFKFTVERNPWDKVISYYFWMHPREPRPTLSEYIASGRAKSKRGIELYTIQGKVAVDKIMRFENLQVDLEEVARRLGLPHVPRLPVTKHSTRQDKRHYRDQLSLEDRDRIAELYRAEIALLGYEW